MPAIALLLAAAALGHAAAHALRLPSIPLLFLAGIGLGQTGLVPRATLEDAIVLGAAVLLFSTGIELSPRRVRGQTAPAVRVGLLQFAFLAAAGFLLARLIGFETTTAAYLALALTASSTLIIVRLLQRRRQMFEPFARLVIGVLLLQNLLLILCIPLVARAPEGAGAAARGVLATGALVGAAWLAWRRAGPFFVRLDGQEERLLLAALGLLFLFVGAADRLGVSVVAGAYLAGVALSSFPASGIVRPQLASTADFFAALFLTALGALVRPPTVVEAYQAAALALLVAGATPPLVAIIAERAGLAVRPAVEAGLLLAQTSELSLVVGLAGMLAGQIGADAFAVIAAVTLGTMILTPFLTTDTVVWRVMRLHPAPPQAAIPSPAGGHVLVLGAGTTGLPLVETLVAAGLEVVVVDDDPAVVERLRQADVPCIWGDASDVHVLAEARARHARIILSTIRRPQDNRRLLEYVRGVPVLVRVYEDDDAAWIRALGGTPVHYSDAAAEGLLRWYEREKERLEAALEERIGARATAGAAADPRPAPP